MGRQLLAITLPVCMAILIAGAWLTRAGDLNPPAGPISPTMKTLTEVEPRIAINATNTPGDADSSYRISQPGSYYLTGNISSSAGKHCIEIAASDVTLDLMGFEVKDAPIGASLDGINVSVSVNSVAIVNGVIRTADDDGIDASLANNVRVERVLVRDCFIDGIKVGENSLVLNCAVWSCNGDGIVTGDGSSAIGCTARENSLSGIAAGRRNSVIHCTSTFNGTGITANDFSTISGCNVSSNTGDGISVGFVCTISGCTAGQNMSNGVVIVSDCLVTGNTCSFNGNNGDGAGVRSNGSLNRIEGNNVTANDRGIDVGIAGNIIIRNSARGNTTNWDIAAGNVCFVISATTSGAILGDSGGVSPGTTNPWANFSY